MQFIASTFKLARTQLELSSSYTTKHSQVTHVYIKQIAPVDAPAAGGDGELPIANADFNVNLHKNQVISYGSSGDAGTAFVTSDKKPKDAAATTGRVSGALAAFLAVMDHFQIPIPDREKLVSKPVPNRTAHRNKGRRRKSRKAFAVVNAPSPIVSTYIRRAFFHTGKRAVVRVWQVEFETKDHYVKAYVDRKTGTILSVNDAVSDANDTLAAAPVQPPASAAPVDESIAGREPPFPRRSSYRVFPLGMSDPRDGPRKLVQEPIDRVASPRGWRVKDTTTLSVYEDTQGVNAHVQDSSAGTDDWTKGYRPKATRSTFDFAFNDKDTTAKENLDAAITNVYYWMNTMHDLTYAYGFTEEAGNFQDTNYGRGGVDQDGVYALVRNTDGTNNANFLAQPDGQRGRLRLYLFKGEDGVMRDAAFDNGIMIHEYSHGVSNRLTGGPKNTECLPYDEPGGLGEGWGDLFALLLRSHASDKRDTTVYGFADYLLATPKGLRNYPYSTNMATSPETYGFLEKPGYIDVHARGSIWTLALWEAYWNLRDVLPFTSDWTSASLKHANTLLLQIVIDGMKLQPCRPRYTDARDAVLQAERLLTGGKYQCQLWKGFAKRGLGVDAQLVVQDGMEAGYKESMALPANCT